MGIWLVKLLLTEPSKDFWIPLEESPVKPGQLAKYSHAVTCRHGTAIVKVTGFIS